MKAPTRTEAPAEGRSRKPRFLITIDTEGDNAWTRSSVITTRNAEHLPRFQALCEAHRLKPTYLTNYEMAICPQFQALARDALERARCEIGMHLHAWNSPPRAPLTPDDASCHPYLIEYPTEVMRDKIVAMTKLLEDVFAVTIASHRAGRWSFDERYARILVQLGYRVDCSVTPGVSWARHPGDPTRDGGTDYSRFPDDAYFVDLADISRPGDSDLLELPMTITRRARPIFAGLHRAARRFPTVQRALNRTLPARWLRPDGRNGRHLRELVQRALEERRHYVQFMLHSSELMPGGSPRFPDADSIDSLYRDMDALFGAVRDRFEGATLAEYHAIVCEERVHRGVAAIPSAGFTSSRAPQ